MSNVVTLFPKKEEPQEDTSGIRPSLLDLLEQIKQWAVSEGVNVANNDALYYKCADLATFLEVEARKAEQ